MGSRNVLVAVLSTLVMLATPAFAAPGGKRPAKRRTRPAAGELRVGVVGWSQGEKRLAVSIEKLVDRDEDARPLKKGARRPIDLLVGVFDCPGFEMQDGHVILEAGEQGPKARAAGWKRTRTYLGEDDFEASKLRGEPAPLKLTPSAPGAKLRLFELSEELGAGPGAKLELSVLEGNPVLTLLRPQEGSEQPRRLKIEEWDAGSFELSEARCTLEVSPEARCLALLCAQGTSRPYLGAYLLPSRKLRIPAR